VHPPAGLLARVAACLRSWSPLRNTRLAENPGFSNFILIGGPRSYHRQTGPLDVELEESEPPSRLRGSRAQLRRM